MSIIRPFSTCDLFDANPINLDPFTENFHVGYYMRYMMRWPSLFLTTEAGTTDSCNKTQSNDASLSSTVSEIPGSKHGPLMGYVMGKTEGEGELWHGHVSAITVGPQFRRLGLAKLLMQYLENSSEQVHCYFVDLFVRPDNTAAINMYENLGYIVYRVVNGYYGSSGNNPLGANDAFDMRKPLKRDMHKKSIQMPNGMTEGRLHRVEVEATFF